MSISIDIVPFSTSLELDGVPDLSSVYSLSGHVVITFTSSSSIFGYRKNMRFLLQSLLLTFEGQTEIFTAETGYSPYRICSFSKELAPRDVIEFTNDVAENPDGSCSWHVVFDLAIPGWLPPSSDSPQFDVEPVTTLYYLHAKAKFISLDNPSRTGFWSTFCSPSLPSSKLIRSPRRDITIDRVVIPSAPFSSPAIPHRLFYVQIHNDEARAFPEGVLPQLRVTASIPEYVDMSERRFTFNLRVRAEDLDIVHCRRLRMTNFSVDVRQQERYRIKPSNAYTSCFPVPPESMQPPHQPLLTSHPLQELQDLGMLEGTALDGAIQRSFSLLPEDMSGYYQLAEDGYIFEPEDNVEGSTRTWYSMEASVPFMHRVPRLNERETKTRCADDCTLRATGICPLMVVQHQLLLSMLCTYDVDGDQSRRVTAKLQFTLPIQFARVKKYDLGSVYSQSSLEQLDSPTSIESAELPTPSTPSYYAKTLPAYSQLFDANGERKVDYSLPVYTPPSHSPSTSATIFEEDLQSCDGLLQNVL